MNIKGQNGRWLDPLRWLEYLTQWTKSLDVPVRLCYCRLGWEFNYQVIQALAEGEECTDLKEMGHHFLPGCVCSWSLVDQTPTCCPCSPGPYCRKWELRCGLTMCHQRNVLLNNTAAEWLSIPTMTSMSVLMSCSVFYLLGCCHRLWGWPASFQFKQMSGSAAFLGDYREFGLRRKFFVSETSDGAAVH